MSNANTFADTWMLFSCMFIIASEILTSMGSMTDSMLNGPSSRSATKSIASVNMQEHNLFEKGPSRVWSCVYTFSKHLGRKKLFLQKLYLLLYSPKWTEWWNLKIVFYFIWRFKIILHVYNQAWKTRKLVAMLSWTRLTSPREGKTTFSQESIVFEKWGQTSLLLGSGENRLLKEKGWFVNLDVQISIQAYLPIRSDSGFPNKKRAVPTLCCRCTWHDLLGLYLDIPHGPGILLLLSFLYS